MLSEQPAVEHNTVLEHHPQLYFSDGDIVLAAKVFESSTLPAGSPSKYQLYRVHRPILRHNSTVFAYLFTDAAPEELYDGVPLVVMVGDAAEALSSLLMFIYNPSDVNVPRWDPNTPLAISPTIRIADKYAVDALHGFLVQKVKEDWPLTLEDWDRREAEIEAMRYAKSTSGAPSSASQPLAHAVPEPASAIRFALEFGCPEILPAACYQLARTDVAMDWDDPASFAAHWDLPVRWSLLEVPDLLRCLRGAKAIRRHAASFLAADITFTGVLDPHGCLPWWEDTHIPEDVRWEVGDERNKEDYPCYVLLKSILTHVDGEVLPGVRDPLKALKECKDYKGKLGFPKPTETGLCVSCDCNLRQWIPKVRMELWETLPECFEVPTSTP